MSNIKILIAEPYSNQPFVFKLSTDAELSCPERAVLRYICENLSPTEIAEKICSTKEIVDIHKADIMRKFDLKNNIALIRFAVLYIEAKLA